MYRRGRKLPGPGSPKLALADAADTDEHFRSTLAEMDKYNIVLGVVSGPESAIRAWHEKAPGRFIGGKNYPASRKVIADRFSDLSAPPEVSGLTAS